MIIPDDDGSEALFMLDTNTASFIMRRAPGLRERLSTIPASRLSISVMTEAELRFGVAKASNREKLAALVENFLAHVRVLPWTSDAASEYAALRHALQKNGRSLTNMDMLIAAHAKAVGAVLVTNDAALLRIGPLLKVVDWTAPEV